MEILPPWKFTTLENIRLGNFPSGNFQGDKFPLGNPPSEIYHLDKFRPGKFSKREFSRGYIFQGVKFLRGKFSKGGIFQQAHFPKSVTSFFGIRHMFVFGPFHYNFAPKSAPKSRFRIFTLPEPLFSASKLTLRQIWCFRTRIISQELFRNYLIPSLFSSYLSKIGYQKRTGIIRKKNVR